MENKNGQGVFYGVIGVATLVVAIIGATFAYFSASVTAGNNNEIQGQTLGGTEGGVLNLSVSKIEFTGKTAQSLDLVPSNITAANAQNAVTALCESTSGVGEDTTKYTGCHLYRIVASAGSDIASATLKLATFGTTATDTSKWNYALFNTSDAADKASGYTLGSNIAAATGTGVIDGTTVTAKTVDTTALGATPKVYYMLVWVANTEGVQNGTTQELAPNSVVGSYDGTFTLEAAGGSRVQATFATSGS